MKLKSGDVVQITFDPHDGKQHRVILERNGRLHAFDFTGGIRGGGSTTSVQKLLDDGKYQWIGNLEEIVRFYQEHQPRDPDFEIPGVVRLWAIEEGDPLPHPDCQVTPTSRTARSLAWIWDGENVVVHYNEDGSIDREEVR